MSINTPPSAAAQRLPLDRVALASERDSDKPRTSLSRDQIFDATLACLNERGYDGTTIRRIAGELGCAVGSIYRYFRDKRELLVALGDRELSTVERAHAAGAPIDATIAMYRRAADENSVLYRLMFWLAASDPAAVDQPMPRSIAAIIDGWAQTLGDRDRAERMWAQLHGSIMLNKPLPGAAEATAGEPALRHRRLPPLRVSGPDATDIPAEPGAAQPLHRASA
ncbi:MAG: helix-turn-helix domain-containing protein [Planctomycetota bacterium]